MTTTTVTPKAIYVGVPSVLDFLQKLKPEWEFGPAVPDINTLWQWLESGEVDPQSHVIFILDLFFDERGGDQSFEQLIATMAPYALVGIISYKPHLQEMIRERVESAAYTLSIGTTPDYYFISNTQPGKDIDAAVSKFAATTTLTDVASILTGRPLESPSEDTREEPVEASSFYKDDDDTPSDCLGQIVAVTSSKGGSGKSTVAMTLATFLAHSSENSVREGLEEKPLKVLLLDMDVRDGQVGFLTGNSKPTVIQLRTEGITSENIDRTVIHSDRLKIDLLLAAKRPRNADDTPPDFYAELLHQLRRKYDYVILDTSVNYLDPLLEKVAYPMADQIVFVTDFVIHSFFSMTRWIQEVTKPKEKMGMGISKKKIGIVLNKSISNVAMPNEKIYQASVGIPIITGIPSNPKIMASAANTQQMDLLLNHNDTYQAIRRLARALVNKKYKLSNRVTK